jgi:hypothetical protein
MRYLADWFAAGLLNEDKLFYVDVSDWGEDAILASLAGRGLDVERALEGKRLEFVTLDEMLHLGLEGGLVERALVDQGNTGVRLAVRGDSVADHVGHDQQVAIETELARVCHSRHASVLCQYDGRTTQDGQLGVALDLHPDRVYEADLSLRRRGRVIQVEGLLDTLDGEVLTRSLHRMTFDEPTTSPVVLDLRQVEALTVGACRALVDGTRAFRERGGRVTCGTPAGDAGALLQTVVSDAVRFELR